MKQNVPLNRTSVLQFERKLYSCSCFYVVNWKTWNTDGGAAERSPFWGLILKLLIVYYLETVEAVRLVCLLRFLQFVCFYFFMEKLVWRRIDQEKLRSVISFNNRLIVQSVRWNEDQMRQAIDQDWSADGFLRWLIRSIQSVCFLCLVVRVKSVWMKFCRFSPKTLWVLSLFSYFLFCFFPSYHHNLDFCRGFSLKKAAEPQNNLYKSFLNVSPGLTVSVFTRHPEMSQSCSKNENFLCCTTS